MGKHKFELDAELGRAVRHFWRTRARQGSKQGTVTGVKDYGARNQVTGGAQMDGFATLIGDLLCANGLPKPCVFSTKGSTELPGWFRPEKQWDLVVVMDGVLVAAIEFKSHIGPSFGNNFNNRTEEALGNATDIVAAYREGAFKPAARPWLGYLMLLEEADGSTRPVALREPHFRAFDEFRDTSYADRYAILLTKLVRERLYDHACLLMSSRANGLTGEYREPNSELTFRNFAASLLGHAIALRETR